MSSPYLKIFHLIRRLQQKNRFIGRAAHSGLTPVESHFIIELDADNGRSISDLAQLLGIDQSFSSRVAQQLSKRKLIVAETMPSNGRRKRLRVTQQGGELLKIMDAVSNDRFVKFSSALKPREIELLTELLRLVSDHFGQPAGIKRSSEPNFRTELRRMTRSLGLLGEHVLGSALTASEWQLLNEVVRAPLRPQPTELAELLSMAQNSLSALVKQMEQARLIKRVPSLLDKRAVTLEALAKGKEAIQQIETATVAKLKQVLKECSAKEIDQMTQALEKYVDENALLSPPLLMRYRCVSLESKDKSFARGFLARELVRAGIEEFLPERILSDGNSSFALTEEDRLLAVVEVERDRADVPRICLAGWSDRISPWCLMGFVNRVQMLSSPSDSQAPAAFIGFSPLRTYLGLKDRRGHSTIDE